MPEFTCKEKFVFWLSLCSELTLKKQHQILNEFVDFNNIFSKSEKFQLKLMQLVDQKSYNNMMMRFDENILNNYLRNLKAQNIQLVTIFSENYPALLKEIALPPIVLYARGDVGLLNKPCVSIVGTRRATKYGKEITKKFASQLAESGLVVVSGLADGVDTVAHQSCVDLNKPTIAVLGCGINTIYPANNINLAKNIEKCGLIISEYQPNEKPQTYYFPMRNRIIAGLSKATIITEAPIKSGALITMDYALESNREVFAIPGRVTDNYSLGCNKAIKENRANILLELEDILKVYNMASSKSNSTENFIQLSINEQMIYDLLKNNDLHYQEIIDKTKFETKVLNTVLMQLEINGIITKLPGNFYSLIRS